MAEPQDAVLICLRVSEDSIHYVVSGSDQHLCNGCGARVWLSKSGQEYLSNNPAVRFQCLECLMVAVSADPSIIKNTQLAPGALKEVYEHMKGTPWTP